MPRLVFDQVMETVAAKGCTLLTTREEYGEGKLNCKSFYDITAACGHPNRVKYDMFKAQGCGVYCKECTKKAGIEKMRHFGKIGQDTEVEGFRYLYDMLSPFFEVRKMVEGTLADLAIRPLFVKNDEWLPIQLKTTSSSQAKYSNNITFTLSRDYPGMLVCLVCLEPHIVLAIPGDVIMGQSKVKMGEKRSKYHRYIVDDYDSCFRAYYDKFALQSIEKINTPQGACQQREQEYRRRREQYLPYLCFMYPDREGLAYDFTVNGYKVQEKVASIRKVKNKNEQTLKGSYAVTISRIGKVDVKLRDVPYAAGDNDFYWINIPDTTLFFLVPEDAMIKHGKIRTDSQPGKTTMVVYTRSALSSSNIHRWLHEYLHDYTRVDREYMQAIFGTGKWQLQVE